MSAQRQIRALGARLPAVTGESWAMEKLREWFGTPVAAGKTVVWICWASFLVSFVIGLVAGVIALLAWGVQALFN